METLYQLLSSLHEDIDFRKETDLLNRGVLDSFDIVTLITEISIEFQAYIPAIELTPENFFSAQTIYDLICRYTSHS